MMKPLYKQPLVEAVILASGILCTVVLIHGVQNFIALGGKPVTSQIAQKTNPDLVNVAAGSCEGLGDVDKRPPNGTQVPADVPTDKINNFGLVIKDGLTEAPPKEKVFGNNISSANIDPAHIMLDGLVDGPISLANVWSVTDADESKTSAAVRKNEVIAIRTTVGQVIKTPDSGRKILDGSNLSGMVMYVSEDGVRFANSRNDKPTAQEGYNLYIWGITPDPGLVSRYQCANDTLGRQKMPEMHVGDPLGTAKGEFIYLALRDNGAFQDLLDTSWWNGRIKAGDTTGAVAPSVAPPGADAPAGPVTEATIESKIDLNDVVSNHPGLPKKSNMVIIAGDSNTHNIDFALDRYSTQKVSAGTQGAKWLSGMIPNFIADSKFALILIGVNEVHNEDAAPDKGSLSQFRDNLTSIVTQTLKKGIVPVLQEVNDFDVTGNIPANLIKVNQIINETAKSQHIPIVKTDYINRTFMEEAGEHTYHFNKTTGAALRNQILRLVNKKLDEATDPAPASNTVSGKIILTGVIPPTGSHIELYALDGESDKGTEANRVIDSMATTNGIGWNFTTTKKEFCVQAILLAKDKTSYESNVRCNLKGGETGIELTIDAPAKEEVEYTVSGPITLSNGQKLPPTRQFKLEVVNDKNKIVSTSIRRDVYSEILKKGSYTFKFTLYQTPISGQPDIDLLVTLIPITVGNSDIIKNINIPIERLTTGKMNNITISANGLSSACTPTNMSSYCVLKTVFPREKSDVSLFIHGKGLSDEKYRAYANTADTQWNVVIFEIRSEKSFTANDVIAAAVGNETIVFHNRDDYTYVVE